VRPPEGCLQALLWTEPGCGRWSRRAEELVVHLTLSCHAHVSVSWKLCMQTWLNACRLGGQHQADVPSALLTARWQQFGGIRQQPCGRFCRCVWSSCGPGCNYTDARHPWDGIDAGQRLECMQLLCCAVLRLRKWMADIKQPNKWLGTARRRTMSPRPWQFSSLSLVCMSNRQPATAAGQTAERCR
jgi:hypothetical protein